MDYKIDFKKRTCEERASVQVKYEPKKGLICSYGNIKTYRYPNAVFVAPKKNDKLEVVSFLIDEREFTGVYPFIGKNELLGKVGFVAVKGNHLADFLYGMSNVAMAELKCGLVIGEPLDKYLFQLNRHIGIEEAKRKDHVYLSELECSAHYAKKYKRV